MRPPNHYLPFIECAQAVIKSRQGVGKARSLDFRPICDLIQRDLTNDEIAALLDEFIIADEANAADTCVMWEIAHIIQHISDHTEEGGLKH